MSDVIGIVNTPTTDYATWLKRLAEKGGKGVVNNIDARALGEVANTIELQAWIIRSEREIARGQVITIKKLERLLEAERKGYISTINL